MKSFLTFVPKYPVFVNLLDDSFLEYSQSTILAELSRGLQLVGVKTPLSLTVIAA